MANWAFSVSTGRYIDRDTGRFLTTSRARSFLDDDISVADNRSDTLAEMVAGDPPLISVADWRAAMRQEIKQQYIKSYLNGRGGVEQMEPPDWGSVGGMLREQYRWLDKFTLEIEAGDLSEAQIRARSSMYMESSREAYERAYGRVQIGLGNDEVRWNLREAAHCPDCETFASLGWQKIEDDPYGGAIPGDGSTECVTNCKCYLSYRASSERARGIARLLELIRPPQKVVVGMRG